MAHEVDNRQQRIRLMTPALAAPIIYRPPPIYRLATALTASVSSPPLAPAPRPGQYDLPAILNHLATKGLTTH